MFLEMMPCYILSKEVFLMQHWCNTQHVTLGHSQDDEAEEELCDLGNGKTLDPTSTSNSEQSRHLTTGGKQRVIMKHYHIFW